MEINNPFNGNATPLSLRIFPQARAFVLIILFMVLSMTMVGCVTLNDFDASQEYNTDTIGKLDAHSKVGQTFISRRPHLNGMTIWITASYDPVNPPTDTASNSITIKLFHSPEDAQAIFITSILAPTSGKTVPITIKIPDQNNSAGKSYYLQLTKDSDSILINGRNEDVYPHGQANLNGQPINADIAFRLSYEYDFAAVVQDAGQGMTYIWLVFPLLIVLWLPGWLLLEFSELRSRFDIGEQTAISIGISLALIPVAMLWTTILNIKWTRSGILFLSGFLVALFFVRLIYTYFISRRAAFKQDNSLITGSMPSSRAGLKFQLGSSFTLILIFLLTLAIRMIMIRDLATPAWVDSVHHALITRLILLSGSYPSTYLPYVDITPSAYHPGFHSIVAAFTWLTNLNLAQGLLILGQVLNALAVFSVYLLAKTLTRSSSIGLFAAIITGFLTPMPAYYTSWGRYTELTGLLILPVALALILILMDGKTTKRKSWIIFLGAISTGGLFMVHYRVIVFLGCLILSYLIIHFLSKKIDPSTNLIWVVLLVFSVAVAGILSVFPWMYSTLASTVLPMINSSSGNSVGFFHDFSWAYLTSALGKQTLVLTGLGLIWAMIKRVRFAYILLVWTFLLFLLANLVALHLPGGGLISNLSVEIMLFMPISILGGYFMDQLIIHWKDLIPKQLVIPFMGAIYVFIGFMMFIGARQLVTIINPVTVISRTADLPAIEWISKNIPENETIVINPFAWGYGLYAGSDGGYWISPLSGRASFPPPVLYGLGSGNKDISALSQKVIDISSDPVATRQFLSSNEMHYVFIGAKGGIISPEKLVASGLFTILYQKDGVWIFGLKP